MKWITPCALAVSFLLNVEVFSQETEKAKLFDVQSVIAAPISQLGVHIAVAGVENTSLPVFTHSELARLQVNKGFGLLHASWDFEAYRHFAKALQKDENCLMAYCGIVLSMSNPTHEFRAERARAFNRMLSLAELKDGEEFVYPEHERLYAVAIAELMVNGLSKGANVFRHIVKNYPQDIQARLISAHLRRGGYNSLGNPRAKQREAIESVQQLVKENPESPLVLSFLLLLQAEAPHQAVDFKGELLPLAEKVVELSDGSVASWQALLGHVAWRSGEIEVAETAFRKAAELYHSWRDMNKVSYADSEGLMRAELYLAAILHEQGQTAEASALVEKVNNYTIGKGRELSIGATTQRWSAALMPAMFAMEAGNYTEARKVLPTLPKLKKLDAYGATVTCYQIYFEARELAEKGNTSGASKKFQKLSELLSRLSDMQQQASSTSGFADFMRSLNTLAILHKELNAVVSGSPSGAYTWYVSAIDAQQPSSRLLPPDILYPIDYRLGLHYDQLGQTQKAQEAYKAALAKRPSYRKAAQKIK